MMDVAGITSALESHALRLGLFERVNMHEPKSAPTLSGLTAGIWVQRLTTVRSSGLTSTSVRLAFTHRIFTNFLAEPQGQIDPQVLRAADALSASWAGDFTLGGLVRAIDLRGMEGEGLSWQSGYVPVDNAQMRVLEVNLPLILNDVWSEAP